MSVIASTADEIKTPAQVYLCTLWTGDRKAGDLLSWFVSWHKSAKLRLKDRQGFWNINTREEILSRTSRTLKRYRRERQIILDKGGANIILCGNRGVKKIATQPTADLLDFLKSSTVEEAKAKLKQRRLNCTKGHYAPKGHYPGHYEGHYPGHYEGHYPGHYPIPLSPSIPLNPPEEKSPAHARVNSDLPSEGKGRAPSVKDSEGHDAEKLELIKAIKQSKQSSVKKVAALVKVMPPVPYCTKTKHPSQMKWDVPYHSWSPQAHLNTYAKYLEYGKNELAKKGKGYLYVDPSKPYEEDDGYASIKGPCQKWKDNELDWSELSPAEQKFCIKMGWTTRS